MQVPWTNVLRPIKGAETIDDVLEQAGLDWEVDHLPMSVDLTDDKGNTEAADVVGYNCVVRVDTHDQLGVVGSKYTSISNELAFTIFDSVRKEGGLDFVFAGALDKGGQVLGQVQLKESVVVGEDDKTAGFLTMHTSHDGSSAMGALLVGALSKTTAAVNIALFGKSDGLKLRHSGNTGKKVKEAKRILTAAVGAFSNFQDAALLMSKRVLPYREVDEILLELIPDPKKEGAKNSRARNIRTAIRNLYEIGEGAALPTREGTAWGLFIAVAAYSSTIRATRGADDDLKQANRMKAVWFGSAATLNRKALGILLERSKES